MKNCLRVACFILLCSYACVADQVYKTSAACHGCPERIVIQARLAQAVEIWDCKASSGMTCRIGLRSDAQALPVQIFIQAFDGRGKELGVPVPLVYPNLKRGQQGMATFNITRGGQLKSVRLTARWDGEGKH